MIPGTLFKTTSNFQSVVVYEFHTQVPIIISPQFVFLYVRDLTRAECVARGYHPSKCNSISVILVDNKLIEAEVETWLFEGTIEEMEENALPDTERNNSF